MPALLTSTSIGPSRGDLLEERGPRRRVGDVERRRRPRRRPELVGDRAGQVGVAVADRDAGAGCGQPLGGGPADAAGAAGDDDGQGRRCRAHAVVLRVEGAQVDRLAVLGERQRGVAHRGRRSRGRRSSRTGAAAGGRSSSPRRRRSTCPMHLCTPPPNGSQAYRCDLVLAAVVGEPLGVEALRVGPAARACGGRGARSTATSRPAGIGEPSTSVSLTVCAGHTGHRRHEPQALLHHQVEGRQGVELVEGRMRPAAPPTRPGSAPATPDAGRGAASSSSP